MCIVSTEQTTKQKFVVSIRDSRYGFFDTDTDNNFTFLKKKLIACRLCTPETKIAKYTFYRLFSENFKQLQVEEENLSFKII